MKDEFVRIALQECGIGRKKAEYLWVAGFRYTAGLPPAEQRQGDPVAVVDEGDDGLFVEFIYGDNGNPLRRGDKLYTRADPAKVEWLKEIAQKYVDRNVDLSAQLEEAQQKYSDELGKRLAGEVKSETKLAERDALLQAIRTGVLHDGWSVGCAIPGQIDAALYASAEPSTPECETCSDHGIVGNILNAETCTACTPVERDERVAFEKEFPVPGGARFLEADNCYVDERLDYEGGGSYQPAWEAWQARAALERKL